MASKDKQARYTKRQRDECFSMWAQGATFEEVMEKHGPSMQSLKRWAAIDKWADRREEIAQNAEQAALEKAKAANQAGVAELNDGHFNVLEKIKNVVEKTVDRIAEELEKPGAKIIDAEILQKLARTVRMCQDGQRIAMGLSTTHGDVGVVNALSVSFSGGDPQNIARKVVEMHERRMGEKLEIEQDERVTITVPGAGGELTRVEVGGS